MKTDSAHNSRKISGFLRDIRRLPGDVFSNVRSKPDVAIGIFLVVVAGITVHWSATGVEDLILKTLRGQKHEKIDLWFTVTSCILAALSSLTVWGYKHVFTDLHVNYRISSERGARPYLILFVSKQTILTPASAISLEGPITLSNGESEVTLERKDLLRDANLLDEKLRSWSWEMPLRGLAPHMTELRRLYLIGSADTKNGTQVVDKGSFAIAPRLKAFLIPYFVSARKAATPSGADPLVKIWPEAVNFEDFGEIDRVLKAIRRELEEETVSDHELCVDITGGQKPTSAAAGAFTLNKHVVLQYVNTNRPKQAEIHDIRLFSVPEGSE